MDRIGTVDTAISLLKKYRYIMLVILAGIIFLSLPEGETAQKIAETENVYDTANISLEQSLSELLCMIHGAGKVKVLLAESRGEQVVYQTDEDRSSGEYSNDTRINTVLISQNDRSETGLVKQRIPPVYQGAVVLCQGADSATVRLSVVDAVMNATGLSSDKITVLRMK